MSMRQHDSMMYELQVKTRCLATITKMVHHASGDMLRELLRDVTISSFIASLLSTREGTTSAAAVRLAELLMDKLPEVILPATSGSGVGFVVVVHLLMTHQSFACFLSHAMGHVMYLYSHACMGMPAEHLLEVLSHFIDC